MPSAAQSCRSDDCRDDDIHFRRRHHPRDRLGPLQELRPRRQRSAREAGRRLGIGERRPVWLVTFELGMKQIAARMGAEADDFEAV